MYDAPLWSWSVSLPVNSALRSTSVPRTWCTVLLQARPVPRFALIVTVAPTMNLTSKPMYLATRMPRLLVLAKSIHPELVQSERPYAVLSM